MSSVYFPDCLQDSDLILVSSIEKRISKTFKGYRPKAIALEGHYSVLIHN
jgi:hypothetical protein